jgi:hypothetical protein
MALASAVAWVYALWLGLDSHLFADCGTHPLTCWVSTATYLLPATSSSSGSAEAVSGLMRAQAGWAAAAAAYLLGQEDSRQTLLAGCALCSCLKILNATHWMYMPAGLWSASGLQDSGSSLSRLL